LNNTVRNTCFEGFSIVDSCARYRLDTNVTGKCPINEVNGKTLSVHTKTAGAFLL
jgi:hypothetical protein